LIDRDNGCKGARGCSAKLATR